MAHKRGQSAMNILDLRTCGGEILSGYLKLGGTNPRGDAIAVNSQYIEINGKPFIPVMGEMHYSRFPNRYWEEEILKIKAAGINMVSFYVIWIHHEEVEGVFEWSEDRDLRRFVEICGKHGLPVFARIGPFVHGECRNGGLPDWLYGRPFEVRSNDEGYLFHVNRLYREIGKQLRGLLFKDGGPVIGIQLENEFMGATAPWDVPFRAGSEWVTLGSGGVEHMRILKRLAIEAGIEAPLYTCTAWSESPVVEDEMLPVQCDYAFQPWNQDPDYIQPPSGASTFRNLKLSPSWGKRAYDPSRYPVAFCEIGCGIQITYQHRPIVPPESVQAIALTKIAGGANVLGFYMFHGGSNPLGAHAYMNEFAVPRISYDFQSPIGEFGQIRESYKRLRLVNQFLCDFGDVLAPMDVALPEGAAEVIPSDTETLRFAARVKDGSGFLFLNNYQDHVEMVDRDDVRIGLRLENETIELPRDRGFTLKKGVSAMFPFNLTLNGALLKYSTTQPFARIETEDGDHYFFFAPNGIFAEYAFDKQTLESIKIEGGSILEEGDLIYVSATSGTDRLITITGLDGETVRITTLSWEQALGCRKIDMWGSERILISDADILFDGDNLHLSQVGCERMLLSVYPALPKDIAVCSGSLKGTWNDIFTQYDIVLPKKEVQVGVRKVSPTKYVVRFPDDLFDEVYDVFLHIDYIGDIGSAFIGGRLVSDNFYNGTVWEIGLKRFAPEIAGGEMVIVLSPITKSAARARYLPPEPTDGFSASGDSLSEMRSVRAFVQYRTSISKSGIPVFDR